ncbi:hypothetical protein GCM10022247_35740 [Allokutzneria multivorans]|uniref:Uncharacterized protein n=1 Tax=Allokutzneria multivorans TaxID=1142134 RepID=A0ABP7SDX0_9PSEU
MNSNAIEDTVIVAPRRKPGHGNTGRITGATGNTLPATSSLDAGRTPASTGNGSDT